MKMNHQYIKSDTGVGNGNPLQYSCLENSTHRGPWRATVQGGRKVMDKTEHIVRYFTPVISLHLHNNPMR